MLARTRDRIAESHQSVAQGERQNAIQRIEMTDARDTVKSTNNPVLGVAISSTSWTRTCSATVRFQERGLKTHARLLLS